MLVHIPLSSLTAKRLFGIGYLAAAFFLSGCFDFSGQSQYSHNKSLKGVFAKYSSSDNPIIGQTLAIATDMLDGLKGDLKESGLSEKQISLVMASAENELDTQVGSLVIGLHLAGGAENNPLAIAASAIIAGALKALPDTTAESNGVSGNKVGLTRTIVGSSFKAMKNHTGTMDEDSVSAAAETMISAAVQTLPNTGISEEEATGGVKAITEGAVSSLSQAGFKGEAVQKLAKVVVKKTVNELATVNLGSVAKSEIVKEATKGAVSAIKNNHMSEDEGLEFVGAMASASVAGLSTWTLDDDTEAADTLKAITEGAVSELDNAKLGGKNLSKALGKIAGESVKALKDSGLDAEKIKSGVGAIASGAIKGLKNIKKDKPATTSGTAGDSGEKEEGIFSAVMKSTVAALPESGISVADIGSVTSNMIKQAVSTIKDVELESKDLVKAAVGEIVKGSLEGISESSKTSSDYSSLKQDLVGVVSNAATASLPDAGFEVNELQETASFIADTGIKTAVESGIADSDSINEIATKISSGIATGFDDLVDSGIADQELMDATVSSVKTTVVASVEEESTNGTITISEESLKKFEEDLATSVEQAIVEENLKDEAEKEPVVVEEIVEEIIAMPVDEPVDVAAGEEPPMDDPHNWDYYYIDYDWNMYGNPRNQYAATYPMYPYKIPEQTAICEVLPELPAGLSIDNRCVISGIATEIRGPQEYSITAYDASGAELAHTMIWGFEIVDPNNGDYTPPMISSITFEPAQVNTDNGDQTTIMTIALTDNMQLPDEYSTGEHFMHLGFRNVRTNQYVYTDVYTTDAVTGGTATARSYSHGMTIPAGSAIGDWTLQYINFRDSNHNWQYLNENTIAQIFGENAFSFENIATFEDVVGPILDSFTFNVTAINTQTAPVDVVATFTITENFAWPTDSGWWVVEFALYNKNTGAEFYNSFTANDVASESGNSRTFSKIFNFDNTYPNGEWTVSWLRTVDKLNNWVEYWTKDAPYYSYYGEGGDQPAVGGEYLFPSFTHTNGDSTAPTLESMSLVFDKAYKPSEGWGELPFMGSVTLADGGKPLIASSDNFHNNHPFIELIYQSSDPNAKIRLYAYQWEAHNQDACRVDSSCKFYLFANYEYTSTTTTNDPYMDGEMCCYDNDMSQMPTGAYSLVKVTLTDLSANQAVYEGSGLSALGNVPQHLTILNSRPKQAIKHIKQDLYGNTFSYLHSRVINDIEHNDQLSATYLATPSGLFITNRTRGHSYYNYAVTTRDGLGHSHINDILFYNNFLLVATKSGVYKSTDNGFSFVKFGGTSLDGQDILELAVDTQNGLYALVQGVGLAKYDNSTMAFQSIGNLSQSEFKDLSLVNDMFYIVSIGGLHIASVDGTQINFISVNTSGLPPSIKKVSVDPFNSNNINVTIDGLNPYGYYMSTNAGVNFSFGSESEISGNYIYDIIYDGSRKYWATQSGIFYQDSGGTVFQYYNSLDNYESPNTQSLHKSGSKLVSINYDGWGISDASILQFDYTNANEGLYSGNYNLMMPTEYYSSGGYDSILALSNSSIERLENEGYYVYHNNQYSDERNFIDAVPNGASGDAYLLSAVDNALYHYSPGGSTGLYSNYVCSGGDVYGMARLSDGGFVIASSCGILYSTYGDNFSAIPLVEDVAQAIYANDYESYFYAATSAGLVRYNLDGTNPINIASNLGEIHKLYKEADSLYVASSTGLHILEDLGSDTYAVSTTLNSGSGLLSDNVNTFYLQNGEIYVATDKGVNVVDGSGQVTSTQFTVADGLGSSDIVDIYVGTHGDIYFIAKDAGIYIYRVYDPYNNY